MSDSAVELSEAIAARMGRMFARDGLEPWDDAASQDATERLLAAIEREDSAFRLGRVLYYDAMLGLPIDVIKCTYERLFELGVSDVLTRLCYARYLHLHGPDWDEEAQRILDEIEPIARQAGLWDSMFGHHPVFYRGRP